MEKNAGRTETRKIRLTVFGGALTVSDNVSDRERRMLAI